MLSALRVSLVASLVVFALLPAYARAEGTTAGGSGATLVAPAPSNDPCLQDVLCKGHYQRARNFSKAGEYQASLEEYQIAFKQQPVPWLLLNIARTLHKLGKLPEAIDKYQRFLDMTPTGDPELRAKAQESLEQATKEQAEKAPPVATPPVSPPPPAVTPPTEPPPSPLAISRPAPPPERPIYKKWSFKENFGSDGGRCWNRTRTVRSLS